MNKVNIPRIKRAKMAKERRYLFGKVNVLANNVNIKCSINKNLDKIMDYASEELEEESEEESQEN